MICNNYLQESLFLLSLQYRNIFKNSKEFTIVFSKLTLKTHLHLLAILSLELLFPYHLSSHL